MKEKYSRSAVPTTKKKTQKTGKSSTPTVLEWSLKRVFNLKSEFSYFYPKIVQLAEVTLSAANTNAWPARGASAIKRIKTRLRNRLKNDMLNSLLCISVNRPETGANIDKRKGKAVKRWGEKKNRRMVKKVPADAGQKTTAEKSEQPVLADEAVQIQLQEVPATPKEITNKLMILQEEFHEQLKVATEMFLWMEEACRSQTIQILILKLMTNDQLPLFKEKQTFTSYITLDFFHKKFLYKKLALVCPIPKKLSVRVQSTQDIKPFSKIFSLS